MSSPDIIQNLISRIFLKRLMLSVALVVFFVFVLYPFPVLASDLDIETVDIIVEEEIVVAENSLPDNSDLAVVNSGFYELTAYSSEVGQTDGNPCRTAVGFNLCEHGIEDSVAANFLPFGTKIRMPELFGDKVFVVRDRMNAKHSDRIDIWFKDRADAVKFGIKIGKIEILGEP